MKKTAGYITALMLLVAAPLQVFAEWVRVDEIQDINSVKHMDMNDRVVYVRGEITRIFDKEGFMLRDDSGEIHVRFNNHSLREHNFHTGSWVEVRGRVDREHRHDYDLLANSVKLHDDVIIGDF